MHYGLYYQAYVKPEECWFLVAVLRSFEHLAFDRTLDKQQSIFEFFVPHENEGTFRELMNFLMQKGIIFQFQEMPNRLTNSDASV